MPAPGWLGADDSAECGASSLRLLTSGGAGRAVSGWCSAMQSAASFPQPPQEILW